MNTPTYIIDFDSTFVKIEAIDTLSEIALANNPSKATIVEQIKQITNLGMEGKITFRQSLEQRLNLFSPTQEHIQTLIAQLQHNITDSVSHNAHWFKKHAQNIYIISGGFKEYITPITTQFNIPDNHILANDFVYSDTNIIRFNQQNPLSQPGGKVIAVQALQLLRPVIVIGDGYTDYQIKQQNQADTFIAFTENIARPTVTKVADRVASSFNQIILNN